MRVLDIFCVGLVACVFVRTLMGVVLQVHESYCTRIHSSYLSWPDAFLIAATIFSLIFRHAYKE